MIKFVYANVLQLMHFMQRIFGCLVVQGSTMGGVQSGSHTLGEALWVHERQRQKCHREGGRHEANSAQSTQDRRKLLKRTRSLAVISEDESRQDREAHHFRLGQSTFDLPRRHQLIPRAKLIDRNSLKDRLYKSQQHLSDSYERFNEAKSYHSRSACGLHSIPPVLSSFPDPLPYTRANRSDPDRLNILDWPESPRRYRSVQTLDTVSGLVDIVEDSWPVEGNRSIDCIYTQVKRKRKEHRSLDSILFEDDGELEYFDVLNLLPLSNVRLEFDEEDARNNNHPRNNSNSEGNKLKSLEYLESQFAEENSTRSNATDEEKCKESSTKEDNSSPEIRVESYQDKDTKDPDSLQGSRENSSPEQTKEECNLRDDSFSERVSVSRFKNKSDRRYTSLKPDEERRSEELKASYGKQIDRQVEEAEDYKSIWISDTEEQEDMSRRPQVLKVVDNDVTKRRHRRLTTEIDLNAKDKVEGKRNERKGSNGSVDVAKSNGKIEEHDATLKNTENVPPEEDATKASVEEAKNFFEQKNSQKTNGRSKQNEGRFERIVKETSNILGKACSAVKGSLGFEARSESSDLGLGSESGSDTRRRSVDDGVDEDHSVTDKASSTKTKENKKVHSNLTRSRSCVDSIECQDDEQEFDHVRYKIVKSNMFSKNMYNGGRGDVTYEGLMQYLREYSFQELLLDNNVVIIEPVRAETIERKPATVGKARSEPSCKIAGTIQKKTDEENCERNCESADNTKSPKQSSIKKHFFYHPIRVNRELIDEELPDPDTVRNVRKMFENTLKMKNSNGTELSRDCKHRKSVSMKDLSTIDDAQFEEISQKVHEGTRSRCSSRAKDLTKLFENMEKSTSSNASVVGGKDELDSPRSESKTRMLAQSFEARSGHTSPSDSTSSKNKVNRYHHHHHHHNWDAGSVSSGVSSDYPDTDPGSGVHCISSEDEIDCHEDEGNDTGGSSHYVSQDVLKKIRECGTSVTYYGGKVVNSSNGPLISPLVGNRFKCIDRSNDYVKFRLVKSNSCDSRLELTGRLVENHLRHRNREKTADLSQYTIAETPSIEITTLEKQEKEDQSAGEEIKRSETKREPPVVIGLEPKKDENKETKSFKADFKLGNLEDAKSTYPSRFIGSALTRWQVNENNWRTHDDFGKMEFEEFEVLEDSLNGTENQRSESS
nr:PREDICTED: ERC protein 2 isoform X1 [Megachile rotundata]XP_012148863.1 PREDICTED: ERC protein 2 isoform X1 [Megachile rotundata]